MGFADALAVIRERLVQAGDKSTVKEVSRRCVDPLLDALGWDIYDLERVRMGVQLAGEWIDYAIRLDGAVVIAVNVVAFGEAEDGNHVPAQGLFRVVTDGQVWLVKAPNETRVIKILSNDAPMILALSREAIAKVSVALRADARQRRVADHAWRLLAGTSGAAIAWRAGLGMSNTEIESALVGLLGNHPDGLLVDGLIHNAEPLTTVEPMVEAEPLTTVEPVKMVESVKKTALAQISLPLKTVEQGGDFGQNNDDTQCVVVPTAGLRKRNHKLLEVVGEVQAAEFKAFTEYNIQAHPGFVAVRMTDLQYRPVLLGIVEAVVEAEGPIYFDVLAKRIISAHGVFRLGSRLKPLLNEVVQTKRAFLHTSENGRSVVWSKSGGVKPVVPWRGCAGREWPQVTLAELAGLVVHLATSVHHQAEVYLLMRDEFGRTNMSAGAGGKFEEAAARLKDTVVFGRKSTRIVDMFDALDAEDSAEPVLNDLPSPDDAPESMATGAAVEVPAAEAEADEAAAAETPLVPPTPAALIVDDPKAWDDRTYALQDLADHLLQVLAQHPEGLARDECLKSVGALMSLPEEVVNGSVYEAWKSKYGPQLTRAMHKLKKDGVADGPRKNFWKITAAGLVEAAM